MSANAFLARQPIVDSDHKLIGYELLYRHSQHTKHALIDSGMEAGLQVIANTLFDMGTTWLLKGKLAFINMEGDLLMSDFVDLLPPDKVVIEIMETVEPTDDLLQRLGELRQKGFRFALDHFKVRPGVEKLLPYATYIKIDATEQPVEKLSPLMAKLAKMPVKLIAEKVESQELFDRCRDAGFHHFQGYYFAHPENLIAKVLNPGHAVVLQLMDKVRQDSDIKEIENLFKQDVALTFKLLRYINSAGFGLSCEVQSIRHAVSILGMKQLYRWLTLLLATAGTGPTSPAQARTAITRGRLCELLGAHYMSKADQDNLFITGVFSMIDTMLGTPMDEVLDRLIIPEAVAEALLQRSGMYGPILALAESLESQDSSEANELTESLMLTPEQVNEAHLNALTWVEQLGIDA